jgi:hypothetical protein
MATLGTNTGTQLTNDLASYLNLQKQNANGTLDTTQLASIINNYLTTGEKLVMETGTTTNSVYKQFNTTDVVPAKNEIVTTGLWSSGSGSLSTFFTSSNASIAGGIGATTANYYYNVYASTASTAPVEFSVAYGHISGSGSATYANNSNTTFATKATYFQYRALLTDTAENHFNFYSGSTLDLYPADEIYVINVARSNYRERMDAGNWQITLTGTSGSFTFIDESLEKFNTTNTGTNEYNIVSGSLNSGYNVPAVINTYTASNGQGYGKFYPDYGILVFNPKALASTLGAQNITPSGSAMDSYDSIRLFNVIKAGAAFEARRIENVSTAHYFVRVNNREFNFSNNPTYTDVTGSMTQPTFKIDPLSYITTVGLFNDANEMIAVAKTSQPIAKSFSKELLLKVKLDF